MTKGQENATVLGPLEVPLKQRLYRLLLEYVPSSLNEDDKRAILAHATRGALARFREMWLILIFGPIPKPPTLLFRDRGDALAYAIAGREFISPAFLDLVLALRLRG